MRIVIQFDDFDVTAELALLRKAHPDAGALVSFVGAVRDINLGSSVAEMTLEHYPGMTEHVLSAISERAMHRFDIVDVTIVHRIGRLYATDQIVLVAVASCHRQAAFAACEFIMDFLKTEAPFWKKEAGSNGSHWVDARPSDTVALGKW